MPYSIPNRSYTLRDVIWQSHFLCKYIYQHKAFPEMETWLKGHGLSHYAGTQLDCWCRSTGIEVEAFVAEHDRVAYVVFCGSENRINDWINNATILPATPSRSSGTKTLSFTVPVHSGWLYSLESIRKQFCVLMESLINDGYDIVFTGHSRGGAQAKIAAMISAHVTFSHCITFGAPAVARQNYWKLAGEDTQWLAVNKDKALEETHFSVFGASDKHVRYLHFVNEKDWVTQVLAPFGYRLNTGCVLRPEYVGETRKAPIKKSLFNMARPHTLPAYKAGLHELFRESTSIKETFLYEYPQSRLN